LLVGASADPDAAKRAVGSLQWSLRYAEKNDIIPRKVVKYLSSIEFRSKCSDLFGELDVVVSSSASLLKKPAWWGWWCCSSLCDSSSSNTTKNYDAKTLPPPALVADLVALLQEDLLPGAAPQTGLFGVARRRRRTGQLCQTEHGGMQHHPRLPHADREELLSFATEGWCLAWLRYGGEEPSRDNKISDIVFDTAKALVTANVANVMFRLLGHDPLESLPWGRPRTPSLSSSTPVASHNDRGDTALPPSSSLLPKTNDRALQKGMSEWMVKFVLNWVDGVDENHKEVVDFSDEGSLAMAVEPGATEDVDEALQSLDANRLPPRHYQHRRRRQQRKKPEQKSIRKNTVWDRSSRFVDEGDEGYSSSFDRDDGGDRDAHVTPSVSSISTSSHPKFSSGTYESDWSDSNNSEEDGGEESSKKRHRLSGQRRESQFVEGDLWAIMDRKGRSKRKM